MRALQKNLLFRTGLLAEGITDAQITAGLKSGRIIRLVPGVYVPAEEAKNLTARDLHLARVGARLEKAKDIILSHDSAAALRVCR